MAGRAALADFNSIKVRLELFVGQQKKSQKNYFNSIKVRLEQEMQRAKADIEFISIP